MKRRHFCWTSLSTLLAAGFTGDVLQAQEEKEKPLPEIRSYTMTLPARIETSAQDGGQRLFIEDKERTFQFFWASTDTGRRLSPYPFLLDAGKVYTFTVEERPHPSFNRITDEGAKEKKEPEYFFSPILIRVTDGEKSLFDLEMCEVHHCKMERKEVPISYGLIRLQKPLPTLEDEKALFPHRREYVMGGCIVMPGKKTETMYVCPQCKSAFVEWEKAHPEAAQ